MVGVRVAAVLVVRRHHVRLEAADQPDQRLGGLLDGHQAEAALGQRRLRVALGPAGVHEAQPVLADAEDLAGPLHLLATDRGDVLEHVGPVHLGVQDRAALAAGAGHDVDVDPLGDVLGGAGRALARLVVGVGVDVHQAEHGANPRMQDEAVSTLSPTWPSATAHRRAHGVRWWSPSSRCWSSWPWPGWPGRWCSTAVRRSPRRWSASRSAGSTPRSRRTWWPRRDTGVSASCLLRAFADDHAVVGELDRPGQLRPRPAAADLDGAPHRAAGHHRRARRVHRAPTRPARADPVLQRLGPSPRRC